MDVTFYPIEENKMYFEYQDFSLSYYWFYGPKKLRIENKVTNRDENIKNNGFDIFDNEISTNINYKFYFDTIVFNIFKDCT